jgi:hypothetical protein
MNVMSSVLNRCAIIPGLDDAISNLHILAMGYVDAIGVWACARRCDGQASQLNITTVLN